MKYAFLFTFVSSLLLSQASTLEINNFSPYYLKVRLGASGLGGSGSCFPSVISGIDQVPPGSPSAPFKIIYSKYTNSNTSSVPIPSWLVTSTYGATQFNRPCGHPALNPAGPIATYSDWSYFIFQTFDGGIVNYDDFNLGVGSCNGTVYTSQIGNYSEAEWFTISSGTSVTTYVQIY